MKLQQWTILALALLATLISSSSAETDEDVVTSPRTETSFRQLQTSSTNNYPTITITTSASDPYAFDGMPATLKVGTYRFKYINNSDIPHNFKIRGATGFRATPVCAKCTKMITVTLKRYVNGVLAPNRQYVCEPHASFMKGTVKITPATL